MSTQADRVALETVLQWIVDRGDALGVRVERSELREVDGVLLAVMPLTQLRDSKEGLDRTVDRLDVAELDALIHEEA